MPPEYLNTPPLDEILQPASYLSNLSRDQPYVGLAGINQLADGIPKEPLYAQLAYGFAKELDMLDPEKNKFQYDFLFQVMLYCITKAAPYISSLATLSSSGSPLASASSPGLDSPGLPSDLSLDVKPLDLPDSKES